ERRVAVGEGEAAEFLRVQLAMRVVADDAIDYSHDAEGLDAISEFGNRTLPARHLGGPTIVQADDAPHLLPDCGRVLAQLGVADELQRTHLAVNTLLAQPVLPSLHGVDRVQQVRAWAPRAIAHRPKIGDR